MPDGELKTYDWYREPPETLEDLRRQRDNLISEVKNGREGGAEDRRLMVEAIEELDKKIKKLEK